MSCTSTYCQSTSASPSRPLVALPRLQRWLAALLCIAGRAGWRQRPVPQRPTTRQPRHLLIARDLNDHILRDIGFIDALPPRDDTRRDRFY